jgi:predicted transposase YbfD/YdcC
VTADAIHCQRETCLQIRDRGGHDLLVVKDNQHELYETLQAEFQVAFPPSDRTAATG